MSAIFNNLGKRKLLLASVISTLVLSGCGGSDSEGGSDNGGGGDSNPNPPSVVDLPTLAIKDAVIGEKDSQHAASFEVNLSGASDKSVSFTIETAGGSAQSGSDFIALKKFVTIAPGQRSAEVEINVLGDESFEPDEFFELRLSNPDNAKINQEAGTAKITLLNNDTQPVVHFQKRLQRVEENRVAAQVVVALSNPSGFDTDVTIDIAGTAEEGQDFTLSEGKTVKIPAGQSSVEYPVNVVEDQVPAYGETLLLTLSQPVNATLPNADDRSLSQKHTIIVVGDALMNDTGVTTFSDGTGTTGLTTEPASSPGQDASYGRDTELPSNSDGHAGFSLTKLDIHGNELASGSSIWSCVRDNVTGLVWEVKRPPVSPPSVEGSLGDWTATNYRYTWSNTDATKNGGASGAIGSKSGERCAFRPDGDVMGQGCNTASFVKEMNNFGHCGFKNWRVPGINELKSVHRLSSSSDISVPDATYFTNTDLAEGVAYLSSTPSADASASVWCFELATGNVRLCQKQTHHALRLVRDESVVSKESQVAIGETNER